MLKIEKITDKTEEQLDVKGQACDIVGLPLSNYDCLHDCASQGHNAYVSTNH
ncbi:hypothetical protein [Ruminiclostridium josui]|uniref:hypothetical protein n=1 Tax=Ruminiclostridium josui TaxID=1499 RepID=UPI0004B80909|nr:hypothetical protein [Ruminiclostridium josui]